MKTVQINPRSPPGFSTIDWSTIDQGAGAGIRVGHLLGNSCDVVICGQVIVRIIRREPASRVSSEKWHFTDIIRHWSDPT